MDSSRNAASLTLSFLAPPGKSTGLLAFALRRGEPAVLVTRATADPPERKPKMVDALHANLALRGMTMQRGIQYLRERSTATEKML